MKEKLIGVFVLCALLLGQQRALAERPRPFSMGVGIGVPEVIFVEAQVDVLVRCQIGLSYGLTPPDSFLPRISLPQQSIQLSTSENLLFTPTIAPGISLLSPFFRFFPSEKNNFYLQAAVTLLQLRGSISGLLTPANPASLLPSTPLSGSVSISQPMPTLSVGYFFSSRVWYFNLAIGATFFTSTIASASLGGDFSADLLLVPGFQESLDALNADLSASVNSATETLRSQFPLIPSIHLSFGVFF